MAQKYQDNLKLEIRPNFTQKFKLGHIELPNIDFTRFKCFSIQVEPQTAKILLQSDYELITNYIKNCLDLNQDRYKIFYSEYYEENSFQIPFGIFYNDHLLGSINLRMLESSKKAIIENVKDFTDLIELISIFNAQNFGQIINPHDETNKLDKFKKIPENRGVCALKISDSQNSLKNREICSKGFEFQDCEEFDPKNHRNFASGKKKILTKNLQEFYQKKSFLSH